MEFSFIIFLSQSRFAKQK